MSSGKEYNKIAVIIFENTTNFLTLEIDEGVSKEIYEYHYLNDGRRLVLKHKHGILYLTIGKYLAINVIDKELSNPKTIGFVKG